MRAVNLIPSDTRASGGGGFSIGQLGPIHVVLAVLVIALAYVTVYVLTSNTISQRQGELASLNQQVTQEQAAASRLNSYTQFAQLAQQRAQTVRQIAQSRFDWHTALSDLSKVMPANASLQSIAGSVAPGAGASGSTGGAVSSGIRSAINAPAFELKGCTATQDDVARLISRLRLINDVQRVTLEDSTKPGATGAATATASSSPGAGAAASCGANGPSFDMVVFFQPVSTTSATGAGSPSAASPTSPAGASSAATTAASQAGGGTSQPVSTPTGAAK